MALSSARGSTSKARRAVLRAAVGNPLTQAPSLRLMVRPFHKTLTPPPSMLSDSGLPAHWSSAAIQPQAAQSPNNSSLTGAGRLKPYHGSAETGARYRYSNLRHGSSHDKTRTPGHKAVRQDVTLLPPQQAHRSPAHRVSTAHPSTPQRDAKFAHHTQAGVRPLAYPIPRENPKPSSITRRPLPPSAHTPACLRIFITT